jgi:hypothetical protein
MHNSCSVSGEPVDDTGEQFHDLGWFNEEALSAFC